MIRDLLEDWPGRIMLAITVLVIAGAAVIIPLAIKEHERWVEWCTVEMGGRIDQTSHQRVQSTVNANGQPGTTVVTDTTHYCLTDDGRIIDIKG
jgi:hypothetical protein